MYKVIRMGNSLMDKMDIVDIISAVREGDNNAFSELVGRYTPLINNEISLYTSSSVAYSELYTEACLALHKAAIKYVPEHHTTFGLYAKICIHRKIADFFKKKKHITPDCNIDKLYINPSIDSKLASAERFDSLMSESKTILSEFEYKVFVYHVYGYTTARISEFLSVTAKAVDNAKNRIFRKLRKHFKDYSED